MERCIAAEVVTGPSMSYPERVDWKMIYAPNESDQAMLMPWSSAWLKTDRRFVIFSTLRSCFPR